MNKNTTLILIVIIITIISNLAIYSLLTFQYNTKIVKLEEKISSTESDLKNQIQTESNEAKNLINQTITNTKQINQSITKITLDLNTVEDKAEFLEELNDELVIKFADLDITSKDFSNVINTSLKSIVSIITKDGVGSGTIIDKRGYIITNAHIVKDATSIKVIDYYSNLYFVEIISISNNMDLALLKIVSNNKTFTHLEYSNSDLITVGQLVIGIGNPLGLSFSVTQGIISAKDRDLDGTTISYIQTDIPINPGNSGGPLISSTGKIIGISTLTIANTEGLGFAIPSNDAKQFTESTLKDI